MRKFDICLRWCTDDVMLVFIVSAVPDEIKVVSSLPGLSCSFRFISVMQNYGTVNQSYNINVETSTSECQETVHTRRGGEEPHSCLAVYCKHNEIQAVQQSPICSAYRLIVARKAGYHTMTSLCGK